MAHDPNTTQSAPNPRLMTGGHHDTAIEMAIGLLGSVLRSEAEEHAVRRRADLLRGRLAGSSVSALRARVEDVPSSIGADESAAGTRH